MRSASLSYGGRRSLGRGPAVAVLVLLLSLLVAAFPPLASAQQPGPGFSSATAVITGETNPPQPGPEMVSWEVTGSPSGATGTIAYESGTIVVAATPVCIGVLGNLAFIVGEITTSTASPPSEHAVGGHLLIRAEDSGTPGFVADHVDVDTGDGDPAFCATPNLTVPPLILAGEVVVVAFEGPEPAATVVLDPPMDVNDVGTPHTVIATATTASGTPAVGTTILFMVTGVSSVEGSCTTDADGMCAFTYEGTAPGTDSITGCADNDQSGTVEPGEPCGEATKIWVTPVAGFGHATGRGWIVRPDTGRKVRFDFDARQRASGTSGKCKVRDDATRTEIKCVTVDTVVVSGTHATFTGQATVDGVPTRYRIDVDDLGRRGDGDTFKIQTDSGYTAAGPVEGGDIKVHTHDR